MRSQIIVHYNHLKERKNLLLQGDEMNIQQLKYVTAVANNGSFREAKKIVCSQPSLSAAIKELENELSITLFTRTNRGAYLTEEGQPLLKRAERILVQLDSLENYYQKSEKRESFPIAS